MKLGMDPKVIISVVIALALWTVISPFVMGLIAPATAQTIAE